MDTLSSHIGDEMNCRGSIEEEEGENKEEEEDDDDDDEKEDKEDVKEQEKGEINFTHRAGCSVSDLWGDRVECTVITQRCDH